MGSGANIIQNVETIEFPYEEWAAARNRDTGELVGLDPIPGTWTLIGGEDRRRFAEKGMNVKAMFTCPRCNQIGVIPEGFKPPVELGDTKPLPELHCRKCKFGCRIVLKNWDKRKLYCVAYETKKGDTLEAHKEYLHAEDEVEAVKFFWAQHGGQVRVATGNEQLDRIVRDGTITNVVGVAPVVGFFANPKNERMLVV